MKKKSRGSKGSSTPSSSAATWHPLPVRLDHGSAFARHVFLRAPSKNAEGAAEGRALAVEVKVRAVVVMVTVVEVRAAAEEATDRMRP